jgi:hypothetical protein
MMTWTLSFETLAFIAIVAIMVALAVMVGGMIRRRTLTD